MVPEGGQEGRSKSRWEESGIEGEWPFVASSVASVVPLDAAILVDIWANINNSDSSKYYVSVFSDEYGSQHDFATK